MTPQQETRQVLNIGGGSKKIAMPRHFDGWVKVYADLNEACNPDIIADARDMKAIENNTFDAVYASHLLEHFHPWEVPCVIAETHRVLKPGGFVEYHVPNFDAVCKAAVDGHPLDKQVYESPAGPINLLDMIFGYSKMVEKGNEFMSHKYAFNKELLGRKLQEAGFKIELLDTIRYEIIAMGRKQ